MILVTLGTHRQPFDRALELVAELKGPDELVIQHGATPRRPGIAATWTGYLEWFELQAQLRAAEVVIAHAGVGTIVMAVRAGKTPLVLPRLSRFGEHVDDHQLQLAERLADDGLVVTPRPGESLPSAVSRVRGRRPPQVTRQVGLSQAVFLASGLRPSTPGMGRGDSRRVN